jgi:hypothetical protein
MSRNRRTPLRPPLRTPLRTPPRALAAASVAAALALAGTGCALLEPPSPTATVTDADGHRVTISWADYPGEAYVEPADVLAAPRAEQVTAEAEALLVELEAAVDAAAPGLTWHRTGEHGIHPHDGNGYGGPTLHQTLNSAELAADDVPGDWAATAATIDAALAAHGYDAIAWDHDRDPYPHESPEARDADVAATFGSLEPDEMWQWMGTARDGSMWVTVGLVDVDRGGGAPAEAEPAAPRAVWFMVGGTVIAAGDERAYRDGTAPFAGVDRPDPTHS